MSSIRKHRTRSDLPKKYSRKHYNLRHRAKLPFDTEHEALEYIKKYECLTGYAAYFCQECGKWHIGKEKKMNEKIKPKKIITEETLNYKEWEKEARKQTMGTLPKFIDHLMNDYVHDYGTATKAVAAAALGAAWATCKVQGLTGFQGDCVMWLFIKGWIKTDNKTSLRLVDFDKMLYPQYETYFDKTISKRIWERIQKEAKRNIEEDDKRGDEVKAHPHVRAHWQSIVDGRIPFGYTIKED